MTALPLSLPGTVVLEGVAAGARRALKAGVEASPALRWAAAPRASAFAVRPQDFRPADAEAGARILAGAFALAGRTLPIGPRGDPWDRPCPSKPFAEALHGFAWLPDLLATPDGAAEGLRLYLDWRRQFGGWNDFAWSAPVLERRVFNLACGAQALAARASDAEIAVIAGDLARQARALLALGAGPARAAERACAAALAAAALAGRPAETLRRNALAALARALGQTVDADGGHATRSPEAALELLFDLKTLDEALVQRGLAAPEALHRAIDRLAAAVRFFTLADGALPAFHGGRPRTAAYVAAARAGDEGGERGPAPMLNGYQRLEGGLLQVIADAAPPPRGGWSPQASAQPAGLEILAGGRRLIGPAAGRGIESGCTMMVGERRYGRVLSGRLADGLGPRLLGCDAPLRAERHEQAGAQWLDMAFEGWLSRFGIIHQRRLFLNAHANELRGEDRLTPTARAQGPDGRHFVPYVLRFHLHPDVSAMVSQDRRTVLLRPEGAPGWAFRNDALDVAIESSLHVSGRPSQQIVLRGHRRADSGARVRWKLAPAISRVDAAPAPQ